MHEDAQGTKSGYLGIPSYSAPRHCLTPPWLCRRGRPNPYTEGNADGEEGKEGRGGDSEGSEESDSEEGEGSDRDSTGLSVRRGSREHGLVEVSDRVEGR